MRVLLELPRLQVFTSWGLLSGSLFVASTVNTFAAIQVLGLSVASGIWCGVAVLTSFGYGVAFAGDRLSNTAWAAVGLSLLVVGIAGIAVAGQMGQATGEADGENTRQQQNSEEQGGRPLCVGGTYGGGFHTSTNRAKLPFPYRHCSSFWFPSVV